MSKAALFVGKILKIVRSSDMTVLYLEIEPRTGRLILQMSGVVGLRLMALMHVALDAISPVVVKIHFPIISKPQ